MHGEGIGRGIIFIMVYRAASVANRYGGRICNLMCAYMQVSHHLWGCH